MEAEGPRDMVVNKNKMGYGDNAVKGPRSCYKEAVNEKLSAHTE